MTAITIRDATLDDAEALAPLLAALGYPADPLTVMERLSSLLATDPSARILVAVHATRIVGFATLHATPVLHRPTAVARVTALVVASDHQRSGAGRALMQAAESHFAAEGWARVEVTSGPKHEPAHGFYRRLGYEDQGIRFAKVLP